MIRLLTVLGLIAFFILLYLGISSRFGHETGLLLAAFTTFSASGLVFLHTLLD